MTNLCTMLNTLAQHQEPLAAYLKGTSSLLFNLSDVPGWTEFTEGELREIRRREDTKLGESVKKDTATSSVPKSEQGQDREL